MFELLSCKLKLLNHSLRRQTTSSLILPVRGYFVPTSSAKGGGGGGGVGEESRAFLLSAQIVHFMFLSENDFLWVGMPKFREGWVENLG